MAQLTSAIDKTTFRLINMVAYTEDIRALLSWTQGLVEWLKENQVARFLNEQCHSRKWKQFLLTQQLSYKVNKARLHWN
jgi:hypothetical protein